MVQINMAAREIVAEGRLLRARALREDDEPAAAPRSCSTRTSRGKMVTLDTADDRTLYFDFLPIAVRHRERLRGQAEALHGARPGDAQVDAQGGARRRRRASRSSPTRSARRPSANAYSWRDMEANLQVERHSTSTRSRRSCSSTSATSPDVKPLEEIRAAWGDVPTFPAVAMRGEGVIETFRELLRLSLSPARREARVRRQVRRVRGGLPEGRAPALPTGAAGALTPRALRVASAAALDNRRDHRVVPPRRSARPATRSRRQSPVRTLADQRERMNDPAPKRLRDAAHAHAALIRTASDVIVSVAEAHRRDPRRPHGHPRRRRGPRERGRPLHGRREGHARGDQLHGEARARPDLPVAHRATSSSSCASRMMVPDDENSSALRHRLHGLDRGARGRHHRHLGRRPRAHDPHRDRATTRGRTDLVRPGHIFPLRARDGGVLRRAGQTEGSRRSRAARGPAARRRDLRDHERRRHDGAHAGSGASSRARTGSRS